jgi:hypothetical protein
MIIVFFFNGCNPFTISFKFSKACVPPPSSSTKTKELNKYGILNFDVNCYI